MNYYLAVDIGASSGRHILGRVQEGRLLLEEIYRFENGMTKKNGCLCWDAEHLFAEVVNGLRVCREAGKLPCTVGIDTWAVDFVLLDRKGAVLGDSVAYRDKRTQGMDRLVEAIIPEAAHYERTGICKQPYNTVYQLMAVQQNHPEQLQQAESLLLMPDYLHYRLTGVKSNEYTVATSTGLVNARSKTWDRDLLQRLNLPVHIFSEPSLPGELLGGLLPEVRERVGFDCSVVLPAAHDTGSAFLAVPTEGETAVYLSSGTWSLLGVESKEPVLTQESRLAGFTNEGGYQYRFRTLKNIMGLWMIQSIRREANSVEQGKTYSFTELIQLAKEAEGFSSVVDVDNGCFLAPDSMTEAVKTYCRDSGQAVPATLGELLQCVYQSLAKSYADAVVHLQTLTGMRYEALHIVGGGSQDDYLNRLTAQATGLPVLAGPTEGSALGNLMVQMLRAGEFPTLETARAAVRESFPIKRYEPDKG